MMEDDDADHPTPTPMEDDNDDVSSSSEDDDDSSENEEETTKKIAELQAQVTANPFHYDTHVLLIQTLKRQGELEALRKAREAMSHIFPLTEKLWLDWLQDEGKLATSDAEAEVLVRLFERAIMDYLSAEIWLEYAQFSIGRMSVSYGIDKVRCIFERALSAVGLHVSNGALIWDAFREFENAILCTLQDSPDEEEIDKQKKRISQLFQRQLSIPLLDMEKTRQEFEEWSEKKLDASFEAKYKKAHDKLAQLQPFEEEVLASAGSNLAAYERYIEFELKGKEPVRVQCVFERALVDNCLDAGLWKRYLDYLEQQLKIDTVSLPVFERAVRNCPWAEGIWHDYVICMERHRQPHEKIKELVNRALESGFVSSAEFLHFWMTYLVYLRRRIDWTKDHAEELDEMRQSFLRAHNHLIENFGADADPDATLLRFWAKIEARNCSNMEKCRELWGEVFHIGNNYTTAERWLEFAQLERAHGNDVELRKLYQKALRVVTDWPESIGNAWIGYEQEQGTLEQWETATKKYAAQMAAVQKKRSDSTVHTPNVERHERTQSTYLKRKLPERESPPSKKKRQSSKDEAGTSRDTFRVPQGLPPGKWEKLNTSTEPKTTHERATKRGDEIRHDPSKDKMSVFLSNLHFSADEDAIREHFSSIGEIEAVRLVRDYKGRSKGFCYLEFKTAAAREAALKKDREPLNSRPVFVSVCKDKKEASDPQSKFKYSTGLEKNKVFVKGLQTQASKSDISALFAPCGDIADVRIVTYRNGFSKGIAYVEFKKEESAAKAVEEMNGKMVEENVLTVAISNPPTKDKSANPFVPQAASRDSANSRFGRRGRGRTQVALVPRVVQKNKTTNPTGSGNSSNGTAANGANNGNGGDTKSNSGSFVPKSNQDFRNMLLNK